MLEIRSEAITQPKSGLARLTATLKRAVVGPPLATAQAHHERLTKVKALAVLSSDAVSSSAYATDEILLVLVLAGAAALRLTIPIALAIVALLAIVAASYRQTIKAYPQGGGSYIVTKDNLGTWPALVAAAALLVDYVLTVAVSISSGIANIASAFPFLQSDRVLLAVLAVVVLTLGNLRGVRESGSIFAAPTYLFIGTALLMIGLGVVRYLTGTLPPGVGPVPPDAFPGVEPLTIFLVLRAFASGCAALTGTEAISDGVPAFKPPEWKNARTTLTWMATILAVLFFGISFLAYHFGVLPKEDDTVVSQVARTVFGDSPLYYLMQFATMLILLLAANTAFSDFPRLSYFLARDRFMPRQFTFRGDRLAYSTGIMALGIISSLLLIIFEADTHLLIPLYAVGVFVSFTLSQASMVKRWWTRRERGWRTSIIFNAVGAVTTAIVALVIASTKFIHGAWIVLLLVPTMVLTMRLIHNHYESAAKQLEPETPIDPTAIKHTIIVPVASLNRVAMQTLAYARSLSPNVTAVHVTDDVEEADRFRRQWEEWGQKVPLVIIESPYRSLVGPLLAYIDARREQEPDHVVTVILPEFVPSHWWEHLLHNQTALRLKWALLFRPGVVVTNVPYHLK